VFVADRNHQTYTSLDIVKYYTQLVTLQPAEATVLQLLQPQLGEMKMLDIGVGGGRTTQHFEKVVAEYIGIDYSQNMINYCQKRFSADPNRTTFQVCDARDLSRFTDNYFDFILFSFNGIDYISDADRLKVFAEVKRVGKPGGYFYFSSHNLSGLEREFDLKQQFSLNPLKTYVNLVMFAFLHLFNLPIDLKQIETSAYLILKDESHNFRLNTYYIRPQAQLARLKPYFHDLKVYSWQTGLELTENEMHHHPDMWLYYLCVM
jgi:ubiquinone/menaquinone biosynthesis C-methylase UbiE